MDNSGQTLHTDKVFEKQLAEMSNCVLGNSNDSSFDWQGFKEFLLDENNFELISNALQQGANAQSVPNQQQVHYKIHKGLTIRLNILYLKMALMQYLKNL